jgi:hypothetical protein
VACQFAAAVREKIVADARARGLMTARSAASTVKRTLLHRGEEDGRNTMHYRLTRTASSGCAMTTTKLATGRTTSRDGADDRDVARRRQERAP